ncbi:unnamed protein product [Dovyalis caffra]|uniref:NLP1-9 GAF domain-containing protein n=1 Tax=Dovyalis caffra TaxID=77055 RepID=A0AAV1QPJ6_9ROSI|nr:unnamed protein product [Dovyalis caffra]
MLGNGNPWSPECFTINQIASAAEIFDILEYVCHVHKLPLALTWLPEGRDANSNRTNKLRIENTACYVNDLEMKEFVEACAEVHLEEGQGVVGKALLSNKHFVSDVSKLDAVDYPFAQKAVEFGLHSAFAIKIESSYTNNDGYILEFFLPQKMRTSSEQERLIHEISCTMQQSCRNLRIVSDNSGFHISNIQNSRVPYSITPAAFPSISSSGLPSISSLNSSQRRELSSQMRELGRILNQTDDEEDMPEANNQEVEEQHSSFEPVPLTDNMLVNTDDSAQTRGAKKRARTSEVWNYFDEIRVNGEVWAICKGCNARFRGESTRGTTSLHLSHLNFNKESLESWNQESALGAGDTIRGGSSSSLIEPGTVSSSAFHEDQPDDPHIMMEGNVWSPECFSINQIAVSAEIFDMLEYICHVHYLPLALTWMSDRRRILRLENSACYLNDSTMAEFIEACGKNRLEEGKGVAGKALQSNSICFVSDISKLDVKNYPFIFDAWEFGLRGVVAIKLTSSYMSSIDYVLEFFLPPEMKEISGQHLLINKITSILQKNSRDSWTVFTELSGANVSSEVRMEEVGTSDIRSTAIRDSPPPALSEIGSLNSSDIRELRNIFKPTGDGMEVPEAHEQEVAEQNSTFEPAADLCPDHEMVDIDSSRFNTGMTSKRRRTSEVWQYFDEMRQNGELWLIDSVNLPQEMKSLQYVAGSAASEVLSPAPRQQHCFAVAGRWREAMVPALLTVSWDKVAATQRKNFLTKAGAEIAMVVLYGMIKL